MSIPESIVREIERAIRGAEFPSGMSVHDGKAKVDSSHLRRLLAELAAVRAEVERLTKSVAAHRANGEMMQTEINARDSQIFDLTNQCNRAKERAERAEAEAAALRMTIEISIMRLLDGDESRDVAKGMCAALAQEGT